MCLYSAFDKPCGSKPTDGLFYLVPRVVAAGIYAFLLSWNEYMFASILTSEPNMRTLPTGLYITYLGQYEHRWSDVMVAAPGFTIPIIVIYAFFQKYVVGGLLGGAIEG